MILRNETIEAAVRERVFRHDAHPIIVFREISIMCLLAIKIQLVFYNIRITVLMNTIGVAQELYIPRLHLNHTTLLRRYYRFAVHHYRIPRPCHTECSMYRTVAHGAYCVERIVESHQLPFSYGFAKPSAVGKELVPTSTKSIAPPVHQPTV